MSIDRWMDIVTVLHVLNRILLGHKKEQIWVSWTEVDEPRVYYTEWSQIEENKYRILMHIMESRKTVLMNLIVGQDVTDVENIPVDTVGEGEGVMNWESIIEIYTFPYVKQIASEKFLHNTGSAEYHWNIYIAICKTDS